MQAKLKLFKYYYCLEEGDDGIIHTGVVTAPFKWKARKFIEEELAINIDENDVLLTLVPGTTPEKEGVESVWRFETIIPFDFHAQEVEVVQFKKAA